MSDKESGSFLKSSADLIALVQQRACLWDRTCPEYRNKVEKDRAWSEIFREVEPNYDAMTKTEQREFECFVTRKWYNIRDSYKKYRNSAARSSSPGRPYLYADRLTFLDAMYNDAEQGRKRKLYAFASKDMPEEPEEHEWLSEVFVNMDTNVDPLPGPTKKIKTEFPKIKEEGEDSIVSVLVNLIEKEEDEDRAFFKSITPTVKSLPVRDKILFRMEVMKLLSVLTKRNRRNTKLKREMDSQDSETE